MCPLNKKEKEEDAEAKVISNSQGEGTFLSPSGNDQSVKVCPLTLIKKEGKQKPMEEKNELKEKVVAINRVAKVVKGGRTFRFSAVVVVGDENGHIGVGNGKASEVPDAIKKAIQEAKKNLVEVPVVGTTVPHEFIGTFGSAKVMLKPAEKGTGLIAGGSVRPVLELAGYKDIRTKVIGTNNPRNVVYATIEGLKSMQTVEQVAKKRGKRVEDII